MAHPEIQIKDELYEGTEATKLLSERVYDLIVTPEKIQSHGIESQPFLPDQVFLSVPAESRLACLESVSLRDIPEQPLLYPQIGGHFLATISTLSRDLRNDGTHRVLIPLSDSELKVMYYVSFLKSGKEKIKKFLVWSKECQK